MKTKTAYIVTPSKHIVKAQVLVSTAVLSSLLYSEGVRPYRLSECLLRSIKPRNRLS